MKRERRKEGEKEVLRTLIKRGLREREWKFFEKENDREANISCYVTNTALIKQFAGVIFY